MFLNNLESFIHWIFEYQLGGGAGSNFKYKCMLFILDLFGSIKY